MILQWWGCNLGYLPNVLMPIYILSFNWKWHILGISKIHARLIQHTERMRYFSFKMETLADHKLFSVISSQASFNKYEQWYWLGRIWKYQISCHKAEWSNCLTIKKKTHKYYFFSSQQSNRDMWTGVWLGPRRLWCLVRWSPVFEKVSVTTTLVAPLGIWNNNISSIWISFNQQIWVFLALVFGARCVAILTIKM